MSRRIQNEDVKTLADITAGGGSASQLINDTKVYVTGVGKQLSQSITDKDLLPVMVGDSGSGGAKGLVPAPVAGDATKYLKGDGTWAAVSGSGGVTSISTNVFTSSGTWTKPANLLWAEVYVVGGGGGGGGARATSAGGYASAGGGAGGGIAVKRIMAASLSASESVTIGAGGTQGAITPTAGGNGGTSSFGTHCSATGGTGGNAASATSSSVFAARVAPGIGSSGDINLQGDYGKPGNYYPPLYGRGGSGGDSAMGFGFGGEPSGMTTVTNGGAAGTGYGSGGSGGFAAYSGGSQSVTGGGGKAGIVVVINYIG